MMDLFVSNKSLSYKQMFWKGQENSVPFSDTIPLKTGGTHMTEANNPNRETGKPKEYFYFDLSDESHEKLLEKELQEAKENPLGPLEEVTKVEY
jgi:hypothetical protein